LRPLDPIGSIKTKLGILIVVTVSLASLTPIAAWRIGVHARYAVPVAILLALVVTQLLARGMTSPLREMTAAAREMARGRYDVRVTGTSRDEVGELARAFNTMAADLEAVDRQRRELVANVSHELRTPVSALQAVLENLVDGVATPTPETLRTALDQTGRLSRLVNDLLDLSRVDAGITSLDREEVALRPFLDDAVAEARLTGRPVAYDVRAAAEVVVRADRSRLHQLVANLLDNAGRHSPAGGTVTASATRTADGVAIEVADDGPGIDPADRSAVFDRFTTTGSADGGTGLGLAIARWVTTLHGGSIEVVDTTAGCRIRAHIPDVEESR
jgi:signal transduction histidine kinase